MKKRIVLLSLIVFLSCSLWAQDKTGKARIQFGSQNYVGLLEGSSDVAVQFQTINGLRYNTWFTGIGVGTDHYMSRSIPLFLSVNKFLASKRTPLYFNGDIGVNFPWTRNDIYYFHAPGVMSSSLYWAGGLGYKFALKQGNQGILLNLGYSYKHLIQRTEVTLPCFNGPCPTETERYDYRLNRLSFKLGWMF